MTIRLAIVDDHPAIATALAAALGASGPADGRDIEIVATALTVAAGLELVADSASRPDVVLCDLQLDVAADGFQVLDAAVAAGCKVIVLTGFDRSSLMRAAFDRGALGFIDKSSEVSEILDAVRRVANGGSAFSASSIAAARSAPRIPSDREVAVLRGIGSGLSSEEIGVRLGISARTVESHVRRLFDRYGVVSRTELAVLAVGEGWIGSGSEGVR